jgi:hypothetical protein
MLPIESKKGEMVPVHHIWRDEGHGGPPYVLRLWAREVERDGGETSSLALEITAYLLNSKPPGRLKDAARRATGQYLNDLVAFLHYHHGSIRRKPDAGSYAKAKGRSS